MFSAHRCEFSVHRWRCEKPPQISSGVVFIMNTIPPQGIGAVCKISEGKAAIPCEMMNTPQD